MLHVLMDASLHLFSLPATHYNGDPFATMLCLVHISELLNSVNTVVIVVSVSASVSYHSNVYRCCSSIGNILVTLCNAALVQK